MRTRGHIEVRAATGILVLRDVGTIWIGIAELFQFLDRVVVELLLRENDVLDGCSELEVLVAGGQRVGNRRGERSRAQSVSLQIGRASCRERVSIWVEAGSGK